MEQKDLLASVIIDQDFPGKAWHCNIFLISLSRVQFRTSTQYNGKDAKGKDKTRAKKVSRCRDCRRRLAKPRAFLAFGKVLFLSLAKWSYFFLLWAGFFFVSFTQGFFSAFDYSLRVSVKSFNVAILSSSWCK